MKVVFNGIIEKRSGGCIPCGAKRASEQVMKPSKMFILPSGITKTFFVGREVEVSEADGEFLMSYMYTDKNGQKKTVFTEVK